MTDQALVEKAFTMLDKSYVPYSHFPVGAALEGADGVIYTGCNVENAAYGSTLCAERTALVKAISEGCRSFTRLAVVGNSADYCWPCRCSTSFPRTWRFWWPGATTSLSSTPSGSCCPEGSGQTRWPDHNTTWHRDAEGVPVIL